MKRSLLILLVLFVFGFGTSSWGQCPEDPNDRGVCDTLNVVPHQYAGLDSLPAFVTVKLLVTHDQTVAADSIGAFAIPLAWTRTNPSAYCSVSAWWNNTKLFPSTKRVRSIFRHLGTAPADSNRMMSLSELEEDLEWDSMILQLYADTNFWLGMIPLGTENRRWWEGDRVLLATMTFRVEDTMTICIDSTIQPPTTRLRFSRADANTYIPRHNLPICFTVSAAPHFTIEAIPDTQTVQAGQNVDYDVILTSLFGFASPCTLTATGLPDYASADFDPNPVTPTDTSLMTISTADTTPVETDTITITGTELTKAQLERSTQVVLIVTSSDVREIKNPDEGRPSEFFLSQNYPNPFNPATNFQFSLSKFVHVKIDIFNIVGQKVRTLVDEEMRPGVYVVDWDGRDGNGNFVSTGIYFYRMQAGDFLDMKKMLLLK